MRVVFLGTPEIAVPPLKSLLDHSYDVSGVFTQPDRPSGRGQKLRSSSVKKFAQEKGIPVFQPEKIRSEENKEIIDKLDPDFLIVAAYGQILPSWLLQSPRVAPLNIHFSLLPQYRGAAPAAYAILNGDVETGVTIMIMQELMDSGPILMQKKTAIPVTATTGELEARLSEIGSRLLIEAMDRYLKDEIRPVPQDETLATRAPRISKVDARILWRENALGIHNRIRAMNPWPGAYTNFREEQVHIWCSIPENGEPDSAGTPGTFLGLTQNGLRVQCGEGSVLEIRELQKPSKKRINGREFASGERLRRNESLFHD
ncbi:MAG: methionyl-tRNA formyltransferase [Acidobacteriota bacterium]